MNNFGEILKHLRKSRSLSQKTLSELADCSLRTIIRIENNQISISPHMTKTLNNIFNINIENFNAIISEYDSYENYLLCKQTKIIIINREYNKLLDILSEYNKIQTPKETVFLWSCYASTIYALYVENNLDKALELLINAFSFTTVSDFFDLTLDYIYSDPYYSLLICLCGVLDMNGFTNISNFLIDLLYNHFKNVIFNTNFTLYQFDYDFRRKYITIINNYAHVLFENNEFQKCLELVDIGLSKCKEFETYHAIEYLYCLQCQALYCLKNYTSFKESLNHFEFFCKFKNNYALYDKILKKFDLCL